MNNCRGITLIELLIVFMIIGILGVSLGFAYSEWSGCYKVEKQVKEIYSDLMTARLMAMDRNRVHFLNFQTATTYRIVEDTNENSEIDVGTGDLVLLPKTVECENIANGTGIPVTFTFSSRGTVSPLRTIRIRHSTDPDYDCIVISSTRINVGKMSGNSCTQK